MFSIPDDELDDVFDGVPLTDMAKAVYAALVQSIQAHGGETFSTEEVLARAGCTVRELKRALMQLNVHRFLAFNEIYDDDGFHFEFCFPDEGEEPNYAEPPSGMPWRVDYSAFSMRQGWGMLDASPSVKLVLAFLHAKMGGFDRSVAVPQSEIAEYTGLSRVTVSRALKWLADRRVIRKRPRRNRDGGGLTCASTVLLRSGFGLRTHTSLFWYKC